MRKQNFKLVAISAVLLNENEIHREASDEKINVLKIFSVGNTILSMSLGPSPSRWVVFEQKMTLFSAMHEESEERWLILVAWLDNTKQKTIW